MAKKKKKRRGRPPTVGPAAREIMLGDPLLSRLQVMAEMRRRGFETTLGSLSTFRSSFRREGFDLPEWIGAKAPGYGKGRIRLGSKSAAIMRFLYNHPRATQKEVMRRLSQAGETVSPGHITKVRGSMRKWFPEIDFSIKPEPIRLTQEQLALIPTIKTIAANLVHKSIARKWTLQWKRDLIGYVNERLHLIAAGFNPNGRKPLEYYVAIRAGEMRKDFIRDVKLTKGAGLSRKEAQRLIRIIRERNKGKTHEQIARGEKVLVSEIDSLWRAFQAFKRTEARLGRHKER